MRVKSGYPKERLQSDLTLSHFNPRNDCDKQENLREGRLPQCRYKLLGAEGMRLEVGKPVSALRFICSKHLLKIQKPEVPDHDF